jgi:hypothetical protein
MDHEVARDAVHAEATMQHGGKVCAAGDEADVMSGDGKPATEVAAHSPDTHHGNSHGAISLLGSFSTLTE